MSVGCPPITTQLHSINMDSALDRQQFFVCSIIRVCLRERQLPPMLVLRIQRRYYTWTLMLTLLHPTPQKESQVIIISSLTITRENHLSCNL
jgi:hypothetical protein